MCLVSVRHGSQVRSQVTYSPILRRKPPPLFPGDRADNPGPGPPVRLGSGPAWHDTVLSPQGNGNCAYPSASKPSYANRLRRAAAHSSASPCTSRPKCTHAHYARDPAHGQRESALTGPRDDHRQSDSSEHTDRLFDAMREHVGRDNVFIDAARLSRDKALSMRSRAPHRFVRCPSRTKWLNCAGTKERRLALASEHEGVRILGP